MISIKVCKLSDLINKIADEGMTMIVVSHQMEFVKKIATKVVFLNDGKIIENGTADEIFNNPKNKKLKEFIKNTI